MGDCKDNMVSKDSSKKSVNKKRGFLGLLPRKQNRSDIEDTPRLFADMIEEADAKINELVIQKSVEYQNESGEEAHNLKALAVLKTIQYHIDETIELMADYADL